MILAALAALDAALRDRRAIRRSWIRRPGRPTARFARYRFTQR
jgi:hypothetical protein